ncbi:MAG: DUF6188 family protein [Planctomycetota bacterium]
MYGLSKDVDLSFLLDKDLIQVCFGLHDLMLHFDGGVEIALTSEVSCNVNGECSQRTADFQNVTKPLLALIGKTTVKVVGKADGTLSILFKDDNSVTIYDNSDRYESYTIKGGGGVIVV